MWARLRYGLLDQTQDVRIAIFMHHDCAHQLISMRVIEFQCQVFDAELWPPVGIIGADQHLTGVVGAWLVGSLQRAPHSVRCVHSRSEDQTDRLMLAWERKPSRDISSVCNSG